MKSAQQKPRWIFAEFQTDKSGDQLHNPSIFDHCNLTNIFVMLNSRRYPEIDYDDTNFTQRDREIDLFGGTELIALDILDKTEKTLGHRKNTEVIQSGAP